MMPQSHYPHSLIVMPVTNIQYEVNNFKGSFQCIYDDEVQWSPSNLSSEEIDKVKITKNFVIIRGGYIFILFPRRGYVNFTKVQSLDQLPQVIKEFKKITGLKVDSSTISIHNITAHGRVQLNEHLSQLKKAAEKSLINSRCIFNTSYLPGLLIKNEFGTAVIYQSGAIKFLGFKSLRSLEIFADTLCACITKKSELERMI